MKPSSPSTILTTKRADREALLLLKYLAHGDRELRAGKGVSHARAKRHFNQKLRQLEDG